MAIIARFPFRQVVHPSVGRLVEPMVEVTLSRQTASLRLGMSLDSGADISLIPDSVGLALGLRPEAQPWTSVRGLTAGRIDLRIVEVHLQIGNAAAVPIRVGWASDDNAPPLLGRLDVFDHFTFEFNHELRMVIVRR